MIQYEYIFETKEHLYAREYNTETRESETKILDKNDYLPSLFIKQKEPSEYISHLDGSNLKKIDFYSIKEFRSFIKNNEDIFVIHGNKDIPQEYIRRNYSNSLESDHTFKTWFIDIETRSINGFSTGEEASEEISLIQFYDNFDKVFYALGTKPYDLDFVSKHGTVKYILFKNEKEMMIDFVKMVRDKNPTILVGFNSFGFDFPYIINRLKNLKINPDLLSPINQITSKEAIDSDNKEYIHYDIVGRILLDYRELYRKYSYEKLPKYSLEAVAVHELGEGKIQHDEYDSWEVFYTEDYQKFVNYGIRDIEVLVELDQKLKFIDTAKYIAYLCGVSIPNVMGTIKQWNSYVYNEAFKRRKEILPLNQQYKNDSDIFLGGWIGATLGLYENVAIFDFEGLYPATIRTLNLGVDTLVKPYELPNELIKLKEKYFSWYNDEAYEILKKDNADLAEHYNLMRIIENKEEINRILSKYNVTASPNGYFYRKDKQSLFAQLLEENTLNRNKAKKAMKNAENKIKELEKQIAANIIGLEEELEQSKQDKDSNNLLQNNLKLLNNSAYGSLSMAINQFSHGVGFSGAVTTGGRCINRLANHYMSNKIASILKVDNNSCYRFTKYHHTDSGDVDITELVKKVIEKTGKDSKEDILKVMDNICDKVLQPEIDKAINDLTFALNAYSKTIWNMEKETLTDGFVAVAKGKN